VSDKHKKRKDYKHVQVNRCGEAVMDPADIDQKCRESKVHFPPFRPGRDPKMIEGYHGRGTDASLRGSDFLSTQGTMLRVKVRYKPVEVIAYFVQDVYEENGNPKSGRSGWLIPGPGSGVFYVSEDKFTELYEIVEDER